MLKRGLGEYSTFSGCHPVVNLIFYGFAIGITMFSNDPWFAGVTFLCSFFYSVLLRGREVIKTNIFFIIPIVLIMTVINTFFTHNGATVLFYLNDSRITLEALLYGISASVLLSSVIIWFVSFNVVMTADKLIYVFGKAAPVLGLTLSMIFRFIPLLKERYREIDLGQKCMGRHAEKGFIPKARQVMKEVSILISWSLEAAIETSDSMEARGYGLPGRTSFHLFKMSPADKLVLVLTFILGGMAAAGCALGESSIYFYPTVVLREWTIIRILTLLSFTALLLIPIVIDISGEKKWQTYRLEA